MPSVVTANDLRSGAVVYLGHDGGWVEALSDARVAETGDDLSLLEAQARAAVERNEITSVYAFDVRITDDGPAPVSVRERIRAAHAVTV